MAPVKFGLFRGRSRDQAEPPSTENLIQSSTEMISMTPGSPATSMKHEVHDDLAAMRLNEDTSETHLQTNGHKQSGLDESQINYEPLQNQISTSTSTLHDDEIDSKSISIQNDADDEDSTRTLDKHSLDGASNLDQHSLDGASTSCDANSMQFDMSSIAPSEDMSVYCGGKRPKKMRSREEQQIRDLDMWQSTNVEVMQNLLCRSGTMDEQLKWEAIANARGLCTLTDSCTCGDCARTKYLAGVTDGDGGLGAAPLFNAISVGCCLQ